MSEIAVQVDHVWKRFHKGEFHDSLRDAIPAFFKSLVGKTNQQDLGKGDFWALKDISFEVKKGESFGIIGHNGAGKSTLLKLLSRIIRPNRGNIRMEGRLGTLIEIGAGFHGDLTGRENIYLNGTILGMKKAEIDRKFDEIVDFSGIEEFLDTPVKRYSSGMHARLGFAVAAHLEPDILIVDEVLSVGDTAFQKKCLGKMNEVTREGRTVLFVSHNMGAVQQLCSRSILLRKGELVAMGETDKIVQQYLCIDETQVGNPIAERTDRDGSGNARILDVKIGTSRDSMGSSCLCNFGSELYIQTQYQANPEVEYPVIMMGFSSSVSPTVAQFSTQVGDCESCKCLPKKGTVEFHIPAIYLVPGKYSLYACIGEINAPTHDLIWKIADLEIARQNDHGLDFSNGFYHGTVFPFCWRQL